MHLYDYQTGEEIDCNKGHHGPVHCVRFAPGGETYASGSEDGTIRIWKVETQGSKATNGSAAAAAAEKPAEEATPEENGSAAVEEAT